MTPGTRLLVHRMPPAGPLDGGLGTDIGSAGDAGVGDAGETGLDFATMRSSYMQRVEAPEWHVTYGGPSGLPAAETIDRDRDGVPEIRIRRAEDEATVELDYNSDGTVDEARMVRRDSGELKELVVARDTDQDGFLDERTVSIHLGGSRFQVVLYRDSVYGSEIVSSKEMELSFAQPDPNEPTGGSIGCLDPNVIEAARHEAASIGWDCLARMGQHVEADLMAVFLTKATIHCLAPSDPKYSGQDCGHIYPSDWSVIYLDRWEACDPAGLGLEATLFHEALHHSLVVGHGPGQRDTDRVDTCTDGCFMAPSDLCLQRSCMGMPCLHGQCWIENCDSETGQCDDGIQLGGLFDGDSCNDGDACTENDACAGLDCKVGCWNTAIDGVSCPGGFCRGGFCVSG